MHLQHYKDESELRSLWDQSGRYGQCWTQTKKKTTGGERAEEPGSLPREQSNSGRKYDSKLHNAVKRGLSRTSDRNLHCSWDKYIHRSIWIGKLFNDYVLNLVGTNVSGTMGDCVHECECLCRCANILALVFSCLPRSSHGKRRPHNAFRDRLNYCSASASQQIYNRVLFVSIASAFDIPIMSLESLLFMFSHEYLPLFECIYAL